MSRILNKLLSLVRPGGPRPKPETTVPNSQANEDLNKRLDLLVEAGKREQREWAGLDRDGIDYLFANQLCESTLPNGVDRVQCNYIAKAVLQEAAVISQRRPMIVAKPREETDAQAAAVWEPALQWQFDEGLKVPQFLLRSKLDASTFGRAVAYVYWEPEAEWDEKTLSWQGAVRLQLLDRRCVFIDPEAETNEERTEDGVKSVLLARRWPIGRAIARWPQFKTEIEEAATKEHASDDQAWGGAENPWTDQLVTLDAAAVRGESGRPPSDILLDESALADIVAGEKRREAVTVRNAEEKPSHVTILSAWLRDDERATLKFQQPADIDQLLAAGKVTQRQTDMGEINVLADTGEELNERNWPLDKSEVPNAPRYPNGRYVLRVGQKTILEDGPWDYYCWPFVSLVNLPLAHSTQGINATVFAKGLQRGINSAAADLMLHLRLHAEPRTKVEEGAMVGNLDPVAAAGAIWKIHPGKMSGVQTEPPPPLSAAIMQGYEMLTAEVKDATGVQDVALGRQQKGDATLGEITRLEAATRMRTALQSFFLDEYTKGIMRRVQELCQKNWEDKQVVRVIGGERGADYATVDQAMLDVRFDLDLDVGTALPYDQEREELKADKILDRVGPAYLDRWLTTYKVPNIEELLSRQALFMQVEQAMAMAEQQSKPGGPGASQQPKQPQLAAG